MAQQFTATEKVTAKDVEAMLRTHYLPEGKPAPGLLITEIQDPTGARRADAIWMPTTTSGRGRLIGHEIKVTRSDVLAELADPTKADAWVRYCEQFWLVIADPVLITGLNIPESWGVMAPPSGRLKRSMTVLKPAQVLKPLDLTPALETINRWMFHRHADMTMKVQIAESNLSGAEYRTATFRTQVTKLEAELLGDIPLSFHTVASVLNEVRKLTGEQADHWYSLPPAKDIAEVLNDLSGSRKLAENLRRVISNRISELDRAVAPLTGIRDSLARLESLHE
jgi:hypothetical protein